MLITHTEAVSLSKNNYTHTHTHTHTRKQKKLKTKMMKKTNNKNKPKKDTGSATHFQSTDISYKNTLVSFTQRYRATQNDCAQQSRQTEV